MILRYRKKYKIIIIILTIIVILLITSNFTNILSLEKTDPFITVDILEDEVEENRLVNFTNFKYLIESDICSNFNKFLLGIIIVTSYVGHDQLRSSHRQAISQSKLKTMGFLRVFLLADIPNNEKFITQNQIIDEQNKFNDLVQGNFKEAYRNLTYKHTMGLKWVTTKCFNSKFVIKIDDDVVFDIFHLKNYLENFEFKENFMAGYVLANQKKILNQASKWYVSQDEYSLKIYPDYLSGWLYITNPETCKKIVIKSNNEKFFWIDDTLLTGIVRNKLKIPLINLNEWFSANSEFLDCCLKDLMNFSYQCDYFVGPNGGDHKFITHFIHQIEKCYLKNQWCKKRPVDKSLKRTCVAEKKNLLERDHGEAVVRLIKL